MIYINPNQLKRIGKLEGFKNSDDVLGECILDFETFYNIKYNIREISPNIEELSDEKVLDAKMKRSLFKIRKFCKELTKEFRDTFLMLLDQYRYERRYISQRIIDYLLEKEFILPKFKIAYGRKIPELMKYINLKYEHHSSDILLVFQLPKPLAQFWWKGGAYSWGSLAEDMEDIVIEWGHFYRELMPVVWELQGFYENEVGLYFCRVNRVGEHDPKKYYYVWIVGEWKK